MSNTYYCTAVVDEATAPYAEAALAPFLTGPGAMFTRRLSASGQEPASHLGMCSALGDDWAIWPAVPALGDQLGAIYALTPTAEWNPDTDWRQWLTQNGLQEIQEQGV